MASIDWSTKISAYLNLGADATKERGAILASIGSGVQDAIERRIGRHLDVQMHTDVLDGTGKTVLSLPWDPVVSVTSVSVNGSSLTVSSPNTNSYPPTTIIVRDFCTLVRTDGEVFPEGVANVIVVYSAGFSVPPDAIVTAGVQWGAAIFRDRDRVGIASTGVAGQTTSFTRELPGYVERAVAAYTRWWR